MRACRLCGEPTHRKYAQICDRCRAEHASGIGSDLYVDRFDHTGHWTRERIIRAIREWAKSHKEPPRFNDWNTKGKTPFQFGEPSKRRWPYGRHVIAVFGSWNAAIEAAGFTPRPRGSGPSRPNGKTCRNGLHPWVPENIRIDPNGDRRCRLCMNNRQREYQQRRRTHG